MRAAPMRPLSPAMVRQIRIKRDTVHLATHHHDDALGAITVTVTTPPGTEDANVVTWGPAGRYTLACQPERYANRSHAPSTNGLLRLPPASHTSSAPGTAATWWRFSTPLNAAWPAGARPRPPDAQPPETT